MGIIRKGLGFYGKKLSEKIYFEKNNKNIWLGQAFLLLQK